MSKLKMLWEIVRTVVTTHRNVSIAVASAVALSGAGVAGYEIYSSNKPEPEPEIVAEVEEVVPEVVTAPAIEVPIFRTINITTESVEKDLTIYISDENDENIQGIPFSVKVVKPDAIETIQPYVSAIQEINKQIVEYTGDTKIDTGVERKADEKTEEQSEEATEEKPRPSAVTSVTITNEDGSVASIESKPDPLQQLYLDKEVALEAYGVALEGIEGNILVDDDANGIINEKEYEPGDYVAFLVYDGAVSVDQSEPVCYEPTTYKTVVNVKAELEMKVVANITKKIEKDVASEDGQKNSEQPVQEAVLKDTVAYVESSDNGAESFEETTDVVAPGMKFTVKAKDTSKAKVTYEYSVENAKFLVTYVYVDESGKSIKESTSKAEYAGATHTVADAPSIANYTIVTNPKGQTITVDGNKEVKYIYKANAQTPSTPAEPQKPEESTPSKKEYTVTVVYKDQDGNALAGAPASSKVEENGKYTVSGSASVEGYDFVSCDKSAGEITVTGDVTITYTFKKKSTESDSNGGGNSEGGNNEGGNTDNQGEESQTPEGQSTDGAKRSNGLKSGLTNFFKYITNDSVAYAAATKKISQCVELGVTGTETLTIKAFVNGGAVLNSITVNGSAISTSDITGGKQGTFTPKAEGDITISANVTWGDGKTGAAVTVYTATGTYDEKAELKDSQGNVLYVDDKGSRVATAADYAKGQKTYYIKKKQHNYRGWQTIDGATYYFDADGNKVTGTQVIQGVTYNFGADGAILPGGTGIDVSKYQGNIDWSQAKSAVSFAIIRCGYRGVNDGGLHEDPYFYQNMKNAKGNGVAVGVYIYSTALNEAEAVEEASMAVAMAQKAGGCSYPIYIDMEDGVRGVKSLSNDQRNAIINAFCSTVASAGYRTGVYANKTWLTNYINAGSLPGSISIWVAQYNTTCTYNGRYNLWQYSSKGSVPGIKGNVDVNKAY